MKINNITNSYKSYNQAVKKNNNTAPSFKGQITDSALKGLSNFYTNVSNTKPFQKFIKEFSKSNNTFTHLLVAESCFLSGFYMINTLRNKKIKKEQKPQMLINDTLTLGVSTAGAYLIEGKISKFVNNAAEKYFANHKDFYTKLGLKTQEALNNSPKKELLEKVAQVSSITEPEKLKQGIEEVSQLAGKHLKGLVGEEGKFKAFQISKDTFSKVQSSIKDAVSANAGNAEKAKEAVKNAADDVYNALAARKEADNILPGFNKLKVLVILGLIYRFMGPVIITPIANKISSKLFDKKKKTAENK